MSEQKPEMSLEEKSFFIGYRKKNLPMDPEPLDRSAYNLGMEAREHFSSVESFTSPYGNLHSSFERLEKFGVQIETYEKELPTQFLLLKQAYQDFTNFIKTNPLVQNFLSSEIQEIERNKRYIDTPSKKFLQTIIQNSRFYA